MLIYYLLIMHVINCFLLFFFFNGILFLTNYAPIILHTHTLAHKPSFYFSFYLNL